MKKLAFVLLLVPFTLAGCQAAGDFAAGARDKLIEEGFSKLNDKLGVVDGHIPTPEPVGPTSGRTIWYTLGAGIASALALAGENAIKAKWGKKDGA